MSRIDPETGGTWKDDDGPVPEGGGMYVPPPARESPVPQLIQEALKGIMSLTRPLKSWEPEKFNPMHIQMVLDRAIGLKGSEIAQKYDIDASRVSVILNHPYADRILGAILSTLGDRVTDPVERMRAYSHEMIDVKLELVRDKTVSKGLRDKIASDFLDRAGYGPRRQLEISVPTAPSVPTEAISRLTEALKEARSQPAADYSRFVRRISNTEGEEGQVIPPAGDGPGNDPIQTDGASPAGPRPMEDDERKTA